MKICLPLICALLLSSCANTSPLAQLTEGDCSKAQQLLIKDPISGQIDAIADQNWQKAKFAEMMQKLRSKAKVQ